MNRSRVCKLLGIESPEQATRAYRVWPAASRLFTTDEAISEWLKSPSTIFAGEPPLTMLRSEEGTEEVISVLVGLSHGNFQ